MRWLLLVSLMVPSCCLLLAVWGCLERSAAESRTEERERSASTSSARVVSTASASVEDSAG
jgi:hypothetical protein